MRQQLTEVLLDRERRLELREMIRQARREGSLGELSEVMVDIMFSDADLWAQVGPELEGLVFGEHELDLPEATLGSAESDDPPMSTEVLCPSVSSTDINQGGEPIDTALLPRGATVEALKWISKMLNRELCETANGQSAAQRRHAWLQIQSVLKYAAGNPIGLVELAQYSEEISPIARWMLITIAKVDSRSHAIPDHSLLSDLTRLRP